MCEVACTSKAKNRRYSLLVVFWYSVAIALVSRTQALAAEKYVYLINNSGKTALTGFRLRGAERGILTCLHGVAFTEPNKQITARNANGDVFRGLTIKKVDVAHDLALLSSKELESLPADGFERRTDVDWGALREVNVSGYPEPLCFEDMSKHFYVPAHLPLRPLKVVVSNDLRASLDTRKSPRIDIDVLILDGALRPGHSGAPVLGPNNVVVAVANGGIERTDHGWAIPLKDAQLVDVTDETKAMLSHLGAPSVVKLFAAGSQPEHSESLLVAMQVLVNRQEKLLDEFSIRSRELREMVQQLGRETKPSLSISDLRVWLATERAQDPSNAKLKEVGERVEGMIATLKLEFQNGSLPPIVQGAFLRAEVDIAIAKQDYNRALALANDQELAARKAELSQKTEAYVTMLHQRASAFRGLKKWDDAIATYAEILSVRPHDAVGIVCMAAAYIQIGESEKAQGICSSVVDYYRGGPIARSHSPAIRAKVVVVDRLLTSLLLSQHRYSEVVAHCNESIRSIDEVRTEKDVQDMVYIFQAMVEKPVFYSMRGRAQIALDEAGEGLADLSSAVSLAEDIEKNVPEVMKMVAWESIDFRHHRARAYRSLKKRDECFSDYAHIVDVLIPRTQDGSEQQKRDARIKLSGICNDVGYAYVCFERYAHATKSFKLSLVQLNRAIISADEDLWDSLRLPLNNLSVVAKRADGVDAKRVLDEFVEECTANASKSSRYRGLCIVYRWHRAALYDELKMEEQANVDRKVIDSEIEALKSAGFVELAKRVGAYTSSVKGQ